MNEVMEANKYNKSKEVVDWLEEAREHLILEQVKKVAEAETMLRFKSVDKKLFGGANIRRPEKKEESSQKEK